MIKCKSEVNEGSVFYFDIKHCLASVPEQVEKQHAYLKAKSLINQGNVNREISPNDFVSLLSLIYFKNIEDEDKIEENEALYMY